MNIIRRSDERATRSSRRRDLRLEYLEGRNPLSAFVPMSGTVGGVAMLGTSEIDPTTQNVTVPVASTGSGNLSHLGKVTLSETHDTVILASSDYMKSQVSDGQATITAANGDQLDLTFTGSGDRTANGFNDTFFYTITGGTGRFACAKGGSGTIDSTDEPSTIPTQVPFIATLDGVIPTVGSGTN